MKNLLIVFAGVLLFSCGKDDPEPQPKLEYPLKYVLGDFEQGETDLFKVSGNDFEKIPVSGSFVNSEISYNNLMRDDKEEFATFKFIELLSDDSLRISIFDGGMGETIETKSDYQTNGNEILLSDGNDFFPFFEKDDTNELLRFCWQTSWATFTDTNDEWDWAASRAENCNDLTENERLNEVLTRILGWSNIKSVDTIALNKAAFLYPLEK